MKELHEAIADVRKDILKADESRKKVKKRVDVGAAHESHLYYSEGLVAGLESALALMEARRTDRIPEGDCRDIPN